MYNLPRVFNKQEICFNSTFVSIFISIVKITFVFGIVVNNFVFYNHFYNFLLLCQTNPHKDPDYIK